ncbi:MAG: hypothetical protein DI537_20605 [Stutzerimonas stutzeri]|nr:MAG: hypothetical protein DI537_20605 [Stutzerimonas stutzeri]
MAVVLEAVAPDDAIAAYEARRGKLTPTFSWEDLFGAEHANQLTVAKSAGFDILKDIDDAMVRALTEGRTLQQFSKELIPVLQAKGWWGRKLVTDPLTGEERPATLGTPRRLETIFNTNLRVSYAAGHWASFVRNKATRPYLRYVCVLDERTRPAHRVRHNLVLPVDHPYWNAWAPPCGWNCRCTLQALSERDILRLQREGEALNFTPPEDTYRDYVNKRTGEVVRVPDGIDPGWAYNPGRAGYEAATNTKIAEAIIGAPPQFVTAAVEDRLSSSAFASFVTRPEGSMPVMPVTAELAAALKMEQPTVALLSAETMLKQIRNHPEMTVEDYRLLATFPETASLVVSDSGSTIVLFRLQDGRWLHAVLKATKSRKAAWLTSYRYTGADRIERLLERPGVEIVVDRR